MRLMLTAVALLTLSIAGGGSAAIQPQSPGADGSPALSDAKMERFLRDARVVRTRTTGKGVTGSLRATLNDGSMTHDAQIQTIDEQRSRFDGGGATEFNFQDSWRFNVAAYRVDRLLNLRMVPVTVSRVWRTHPAAFTWWVDDVTMDEGSRLRTKTAPPEPQRWNEQMQMVRLFDQLIYNVDRNMGNLLIDNGWRAWAIDHTRAFRVSKTLKSPAAVVRCDREVLDRLRSINRDTLRREVGEFISDYQIQGLLARRDQIVGVLERGGAAAIFERRWSWVSRQG